MSIEVVTQKELKEMIETGDEHTIVMVLLDDKESEVSKKGDIRNE